jgi:hypothetical protein
MDLGELNAKISAQIDEFERNMDKASGKVNDFAGSSQAGGKKAGAGMAVAGKAALALKVGVAAVAAAAVAAGAALIGLGERGMTAADEQAKLARQLGITNEELAVLTKAGDFAGVSASTMQSNMERLNRTLGDAVIRGGSAAQSFERLGIDYREFANMRADDQMRVLADAMSGVETRAEQAAIANELFGRSGQQMLVFLDDAQANLDRASTRVEAFGLAVDEIDSSAIEDANDALSAIGDVVAGIANRIAARVAPLIKFLALKFEEVAIETRGFERVVDGAFNFVIRSAKFVADAIEGIRRVFATVRHAGAIMGHGVISIFADIVTAVSNTIDSGIAKLNTMIEVVNKLPFMDFDFITPTAETKFVNTVKGMADKAQQEMRISAQAVRSLWEQPMPSAGIDDFLDSLKRTEEQAASTRAAFAPPDVDDEDFSVDIEPRYRDQLQKLREFLMDEQELLEHRYGQRRSLLNEALDAEEIDQEEHYAMMAALNERYENELEEMRKRSAESSDPMYEQQLDSLREFLMTEEQMMQHRFQQRRDLLDAALEAEELSQAEHFDMLKELEEQHWHDIAELRKKQMTDMERFAAMSWHKQTSTIAGELASLTSNLDRENRAQFAIQKAGAMASAAVNMYEGISRSLSAYPMPLAAVMAAAHAAAGMAQVNSIRQQQFGQGASAPAIPSAPAADATQAGMQQTLMVQGDFDSTRLFTGTAVRDLMDRISEAQRDGYKVVLA